MKFLNNKQRAELKDFAVSTVDNFEENDDCSREEAIETMRSEAINYYEAAAEWLTPLSGPIPVLTFPQLCDVALKYLKEYKES